MHFKVRNRFNFILNSVAKMQKLIYIVFISCDDKCSLYANVLNEIEFT